MTSKAPRIFIGTPTANGFVAAEHAASLAGMISSLHSRGITARYRNVDGPDLPIQRDMLAADFLQSDSTHLLFIDGDMAFAAGLCETLLGFSKQVIGAAYATRPLDLGRLEQQAKTQPFEGAAALSYEWNIRLLGGALTVKDGIGRVESLGPGFFLIERGALARIASDKATPTYASPTGNRLLPALFRDLSLGSAVWSHDHVFCRRWAALGGETWVYPRAQVRRTIEMRFGMPYRRFLQATLATAASGVAAEADGALASGEGG